MKLIIDIDDKTYETIKNAEPLKWDCPIESAYKAIKNGTSLDKILEQEPCDDAISRQAVLDGIDTYINKAQSTGTQDDFYSFAELVVKELPPVTPKQKIGRWIPVSERLPEDKQSVLVWCPQYKNIYCSYREKEQWWIFWSICSDSAK